MNTARLSRCLVGRPRPLMVAVQDHVHALEHEALGIVLEREDALAAQDARPVFSDQVLDPGKKLVGVERLVGLQRHRLHLFVVIVLETCAMMTMVGAMIAMAMNMMMSVVMVVSLQELRLDVEDAVEVEGVAAEHLVERDFGALGAMQPRVRIEPADARLQLGEFARRHQVGLVEQNDVGKGDLVLGLGRVLEPVLQPLGVGDGHHRIEFGLGADLLVHEEGLRHRRRVGQARRLDDDGVELALSPHQPVDDAHQVAAHGAADAAVVHLEHFLVGVDHQLVVDADFAEFVDDDGVFLAVRLGQNAVEQRGLAGAEIAGEHGDGDFGGLRGRHRRAGSLRR